MTRTQQNTLDFTKPIQTRDGRKVRIVSTGYQLQQDSDKYCVVAEVENEGYLTFTTEGKFVNGEVSDLDLLQVPEETFDQKVQRFKKSEYFISHKDHQYGTEILTWTHACGFQINNNFEDAMQEVDFA